MTQKVNISNNLIIETGQNTGNLSLMLEILKSLTAYFYDGLKSSLTVCPW